MQVGGHPGLSPGVATVGTAVGTRVGGAPVAVGSGGLVGAVVGAAVGVPAANALRAWGASPMPDMSATRLNRGVSGTTA